jgi:hypothetical protein
LSKVRVVVVVNRVEVRLRRLRSLEEVNLEEVIVPASLLYRLAESALQLLLLKPGLILT